LPAATESLNQGGGGEGTVEFDVEAGAMFGVSEAPIMQRKASAKISSRSGRLCVSQRWSRAAMARAVLDLKKW
jgi:hypothetical protein